MRFEQALEMLREGKSMTYGDGTQTYFMVDGKMYFNYQNTNYKLGQVFVGGILAEDWRPQFLGNKEVTL